MRRLAAVWLVLALLLAFFPAALADDDYTGMLAQDHDAYGMVIGGTLNMRAEPSASAKLVKSYPAGSWFRIIGGRPERDYYFVAAGDGRNGYVLTKYVLYCDNYALTNGKFVYPISATVAGPSNYVNLRTGPKSTASVITRVNNGSSVSITLYGDVYSKVTTSGGKTGYMSTGLLRMFDQIVWEERLVVSPNKGKVNLRGGPVNTAPILGSYAADTPLIVLVRGIGWHKVIVKGKVGYMMAPFVSIVD